jgi:hypothetical protein
LYLEADGDVVERAELRSREEPRPAQDKDPYPTAVEAATVLDCTVRQVYGLAPIAVSEPLEALLGATGVCRLPTEPASPKRFRFLVKNDVGYFLLAGEPSGFDFVGPYQADLSIPDAGEGWDDLDFAML